MSAIHESFWGVTAQIALFVGFSPCGYLSFSGLLIAKSISTCPPILQLLKLCCISYNLLFLLFFGDLSEL